MNYINAVLAITTSLMISACGGGGGGSPNTADPDSSNDDAFTTSFVSTRAQDAGSGGQVSLDLVEQESAEIAVSNP